MENKHIKFTEDENLSSTGDENQPSIDVFALVEKRGTGLLRMLVRFGHSIRDVSAREDIAQDTLLALLRHNGLFQSEKHVLNWLYRVASNKIKDYKKDVHKMFPHELVAATTDIEVGDVVSEFARDQLFAPDFSNQLLADDVFLQQINQLPEQQAKVVLLRIVDDYDYDTIAKILEIEPSTARNNFAKAKNNLKKIMRQDTI